MSELLEKTDENQRRLVQANYDSYPESVRKLQDSHLRFPRVVSIETQVKCNAKCSFCPYPESPRQGQEMTEELFLKIIDDLTAIPVSHAFRITLSRINEPLLDRRLRYFHEVIADKLPSATPQFWSNGTMLREGLFEWMAYHSGATLTISLNSMDEEEHKELMGFGLKRVLTNLDYVHKLAEAGEFPLRVFLVAPYKSDQQADRIESTCIERWPLFTPGIRPFFKWVGGSGKGEEHRAASKGLTTTSQKAQHFTCAQWFDLHILASGYVTKCCIDESGFNHNETYNVSHRNALEIFAESARLRQQLPDRTTVEGCEGCQHLG